MRPQLSHNVLHIQIPFSTSFMGFLHCHSFKKYLAKTKQQTSRNWIHSFYSSEYFSWYVYFLNLTFVQIHILKPFPTKKLSDFFKIYYPGKKIQVIKHTLTHGACRHMWVFYDRTIFSNWNIIIYLVTTVWQVAPVSPTVLFTEYRSCFRSVHCIVQFVCIA